MAQQSLTNVNEIMPVIKPAQAWPYAGVQHLGRLGSDCKDKSNNCAGNAHGIKPATVRPPNQLRA